MPNKKKMKQISQAIITILLLTVFSVLTWYLINNFQKNNRQEFTLEDVKPELEFAENTNREVQQKPFLKSLPINTDNYSITYSGLRNKIVIIFRGSVENINLGRNQYEQEIISKLADIGVDNDKIDISWEIVSR